MYHYQYGTVHRVTRNSVYTIGIGIITIYWQIVQLYLVLNVSLETSDLIIRDYTYTCIVVSYE